MLYLYKSKNKQLADPKNQNAISARTETQIIF